MKFLYLIVICFITTVSCFQDINHHFHKLPRLKTHHSEIHEVVFAIKRDNVDQLELRLNDVSDPFSENYGRHMTKAEINSYTNTAPRFNRLRNHLESKGFEISPESTCCDYLRVRGSIGKWESFLKTRFDVFSAVSPYYPLAYRQQKHFRATTTYTIPMEIKSDIQHIFNVKEFAPPVLPSINKRDVTDEVMQQLHKKQLEKNHILSSIKSSLRGFQSDKAELNSIAVDWIDIIDGFVTPNLLNQLYDIRSNRGNNLTNQCTYQAGSWFSAADLIKFQDYFSLPKDPIALDIGQTQNDTLCTIREDLCGEANLDIQYIMAVAQNVPTITYEWGDGLGLTDPWLAWILAVSNMTDPAPPDVISISYISYEYQFDENYARSFSQEAMLLSLQGVTILAATGDDGVAGYFMKKGTITCGYYPMFPASCPYVTAIGGTTGPEFGEEEDVVCAAEKDKVFITSGGGFSNLYRRPIWQDKYVDAYFQQITPPTGSGSSPFNMTGRGYPDISAIGNNYLIVLNSKLVSVSGTSASCPVVAAMVTLINSERLARNASRLGWINPLLYAHNLSSIWTKDVVKGNNSCTSIAGLCCAEGFPAAPGWDPSTGLGILNFTRWRDVSLGLVDSMSMQTWSPSQRPTAIPTWTPTFVPTYVPTSARPSVAPTTSTPTYVPTYEPTATPTDEPTFVPTATPTTHTPTYQPTSYPSVYPSSRPTSKPSISHAPSHSPTFAPTCAPTETPTLAPSTSQPTVIPTHSPTRRPTAQPTYTPTLAPSRYYETQQVTFQVVHEISPLLLAEQAQYEAYINASTLSNVLANLTCTQLFNNSLDVVQQGLAKCTVVSEFLVSTVLSVSPTVSPTVSPSLSPSVSPTLSPTAAPTTLPLTTTESPSTFPTEAPSNGMTTVVSDRRRLSMASLSRSRPAPSLRTTSQSLIHTAEEGYLTYECTVSVRVALATLLTYLPANTPLVDLLSTAANDSVLTNAIYAELPAIVANLTSHANDNGNGGAANLQSFLTSLNPVLFASVSSIGFASLVPSSLAVNTFAYLLTPSLLPTRSPSNEGDKESLTPESVSKGLWNGQMLIVVIAVCTAITSLMCVFVLYTCCCYEPPYDTDEEDGKVAPFPAAAIQDPNGHPSSAPKTHQHHHHHHMQRHNRVVDEQQELMRLQYGRPLTEDEERDAAIAAVAAAERANERKRKRQQEGKAEDSEDAAAGSSSSSSSQRRHHHHHRRHKRGMHPLLRATMISPFMSEEEKQVALQQRQAYLQHQEQRRASLLQQKQTTGSPQQQQQQHRNAKSKEKRSTKPKPSSDATSNNASSAPVSSAGTTTATTQQQVLSVVPSAPPGGPAAAAASSPIF